MKNEDLKKVLKPLIKQCIKEVIFEEGVLSGIIAEVATGLTATAEPLVEKKSAPSTKAPRRSKTRTEETKKKLFEAISKDAYNGVNLFENTEPLTRGGTPGQDSTTSNPLASYAPDDAGVNIDGIMDIAGTNWSKLI